MRQIYGIDLSKEKFDVNFIDEKARDDRIVFCHPERSRGIPVTVFSITKSAVSDISTLTNPVNHKQSIFIIFIPSMKIKSILTLLIAFTLIQSCNKEAEPELVMTIGVEIIEIANPPSLPDICTQSLIEPLIRIKNSNITTIDSLYIIYLLRKEDTSYFGDIGPATKWYGSLKTGEEQLITLNKWDTTNGNLPLNNGVYSLTVSIQGINEGKYFPDAFIKQIIFQLEQ